MIYHLDHRPLNREGHPSVRPWRVLRPDGTLFRTFTTRETAIAALDLLRAGGPYSRHAIYRRMNRYGAKSRHNRKGARA